MLRQVILEYVGHVCFMAGTLKATRGSFSESPAGSWPSPWLWNLCWFQERRRVKQFLDWLLAQRLCLSWSADSSARMLLAAAQPIRPQDVAVSQ